MDCTEVRDHLSAWIDRELPLDRAWRIEQHLRECPACTRESEELRELVGWVADVPRFRVPAELTAAIQEQLTRVEPEPARIPFLARYKGPVQAFATVAAVLAIAAVNQFTYRPAPVDRAPGTGMPVPATSQPEDATLSVRTANSGAAAEANSLSAKKTPASPARKPESADADRSFGGSQELQQESEELGRDQRAHQSAKDEAWGGRESTRELERAQAAAGAPEGDKQGIIGGADSSANATDHAESAALRGRLKEQQKLAVADPAGEFADGSAKKLAGKPAGVAGRKDLAAADAKDAPDDKARQAATSQPELGLFASTPVISRVVRGSSLFVEQTLRNLESETANSASDYRVERTGSGRTVVRITLARPQAERILLLVEGSQLAARMRRSTDKSKSKSTEAAHAEEGKERHDDLNEEVADAHDELEKQIDAGGSAGYSRRGGAARGGEKGEGRANAPAPGSDSDEPVAVAEGHRPVTGGAAGAEAPTASAGAGGGAGGFTGDLGATGKSDPSPGAPSEKVATAAGPEEKSFADDGVPGGTKAGLAEDMAAQPQRGIAKEPEATLAGDLEEPKLREEKLKKLDEQGRTANKRVQSKGERRKTADALAAAEQVEIVIVLVEEK